MIGSKWYIAASLLPAAIAAPVGATIIYTGGFDLTGGHGAVADARLDLSFTTEGMLGFFNAANILDYRIMITQGAVTATLTPLNSGIEIGGPDKLSATSTAISYLFDGLVSGVLIFDRPNRGPFFCMQSDLCNNPYGLQIQASLDLDVPSDRFSPFLPASGIVEIARAVTALVPEPATWAMMILGFGLVGAMARREARAVANGRL